jgi:hypothetical protein
MSDTHHQLLHGFVVYWARERQPDQVRENASRAIAYHSFMAGATCVLEKILGGDPPSPDQMVDLVDQLARETGEHMSQARVRGAG